MLSVIAGSIFQRCKKSSGGKRNGSIIWLQRTPDAATPPAQEPPAGKALGEAQKILTYLKENERAVFRKMSGYLEGNSIVPESSSTNKLVQIRKYKVLRVDGDRAFVAINFETAYRIGAGGTSNPHKMVFQLRWIDGELEFVGHEKS